MGEAAGRRPRNSVKKRLMGLLDELTFATTGQLMRAMDAETWSERSYLYRRLSRLLDSGQIHEMGDSRLGGQRILYAGSPDRTNWQHARGVADLKIAVARSCQSLGYAYSWAGDDLKHSAGLSADGLLIFEKPTAGGPATRRLVVMEYQRTKLSCQRAAEKLQRFVGLHEHLMDTFNVSHVYVLASFDLWPLGLSERWLQSLVHQVADWHVYVTSHVRLLDIPPEYLLTAPIWSCHGHDGLVPIFVKE